MFGACRPRADVLHSCCLPPDFHGGENGRPDGRTENIARCWNRRSVPQNAAEGLLTNPPPQAPPGRVTEKRSRGVVLMASGDFIVRGAGEQLGARGLKF